MSHALITAGLFATALLFGSMMFFSAVMAPLIFVKLGGEAAGRFIRQVFPWYYLVVIALAAVGAAALAFPRPVDAAVLGAVAAVGVAARQVLMPMINRARDAMLAGDAASKTRFSGLHRLSVWINAAQIVAVAVGLARFV
jgi:hypothetical protein